MPYNLSVFRELCERFPSWTSFRTWLESDEGGLLKIIESADSSSNQVIIRYEKGISNPSPSHVRWFRSVVWDIVANRPICVAPPKASDTPCEGSLQYEEFLEGFMINLYRTGTDNTDTVYMVSRSNFGATGTFYSPKQFCELFREAIPEGVTLDSYIPSGMSFVSLLVQHPEHRVVYKAPAPRVYQIHAGRVTAEGDVEIMEDHLPYGPPTLESPMEGESMNDYVICLASVHGWSWQGVVCKNGSGDRWRFRSATYQMVRSLRGNTTRNDVRFVQLYQTNLVDTYLYYYPEDAQIFGVYKQLLRTTVKLLYDRYVRYHITKTLKQEEVEHMWRPHLFHLHGKYLYTLRSKSQFIREKDVWEYAMGLPWQQLLFIMNRRETAPAYMPVTALGSV